VLETIDNTARLVVVDDATDDLKLAARSKRWPPRDTSRC